MILVVDANVVIAALVKGGKSREILMSGKFKFVAPDFVKEETLKYLELIRRKSGLAKEDLDLLITLLFQEIETVPESEYGRELPKAKAIMTNDQKDAPYVACYLSLKCDGIWTSDSDFGGKPELKIVGTEYLLKLL
ncbi:tRNA(fMet)-specific endonuclease VapC [uncultured archaeon]|nr:tRNA(fMet)-specific endonuclease VapC [uncultured archaeon]